MSRFSFKLEKILDLRKFEQRQAEIELGKAVAAENAIQEQLDEIAKQHASTVGGIKDSRNITVIAAAQRYFSLLDTHREQLLQELVQAKLITETKRKIMETAVQNCRALSKMKEHEQTSFLADELRKEEDTTDDIVTSRYSG
jgi:flagellar FliJ protein